MEKIHLGENTLYGKFSNTIGNETRELEVYVDFADDTTDKQLSLFITNKSEKKAYSESTVVLLDSAEFDELLIFLGYSKTLGGTDYGRA